MHEKEEAERTLQAERKEREALEEQICSLQVPVLLIIRNSCGSGSSFRVTPQGPDPHYNICGATSLIHNQKRGIVSVAKLVVYFSRS